MDAQNVDDKIETNQINDIPTAKSNELLSQLKRVSLHEIMSGDKNLSSENFFYTDKIEKQTNIDGHTKKALENANIESITTYNNLDYNNLDNENVVEENIENDNLDNNISDSNTASNITENKQLNEQREYREGNDPNKAIINTDNKPGIRRVNSKRTYKFPRQSYLNHSIKDTNNINKNALNETANVLQMTLEQIWCEG